MAVKKINVSLTAMKKDMIETGKVLNGNNNIRIAKFKMLVENIQKTLGNSSLIVHIAYTTSYEVYAKVWLAVIYDYDSLNDFGRAIMDWVCELDENNSMYIERKMEFMDACRDMEYRLNAIRSIVEDLNSFNKEKIYFIFWAMMILTVDDTDKEEHLSLICDFAKMLKISDEEMLDIVQVIQVIYHKEEAGFKFRSSKVWSCFEKLLKQYGYDDPEDDPELDIT